MGSLTHTHSTFVESCPLKRARRPLLKKWLKGKQLECMLKVNVCWVFKIKIQYQHTKILSESTTVTLVQSDGFKELMREKANEPTEGSMASTNPLSGRWK